MYRKIDLYRVVQNVFLYSVYWFTGFRYGDLFGRYTAVSIQTVFNIPFGLFADVKRCIIHNKNESFDILLAHTF